MNFRFVAEGDRPQCQDRFACLLHGFNFIFETLRGRRDAKSALVVYHNCPASNAGHTDARDKGGSLGSYGSDADDSRLSCNPGVAYIDIVAAGGEVGTSVGTDGDVGGTGCVAYQCILTEGRVVAARGVIGEPSLTAGCVKVASVVALKRLKAISRVVVAATQRLKTGRCVFGAAAVARKCKGADGRIEASGGIKPHRRITAGHVVTSGGVEKERTQTASGVEATGRIAFESEIAEGGVLNTGGIAGERFGTNGSVAAAGGVAKKGINTVGRVVAAGGVAKERLKTGGRVAEASSVAKERIVTEN